MEDKKWQAIPADRWEWERHGSFRLAVVDPAWIIEQAEILKHASQNSREVKEQGEWTKKTSKD